MIAVAAFDAGANSKFVVVLTIAISTTLISYLWIFPAAVKLRSSHGHVNRPYRVPGGRDGIRGGGRHHHVLGRARLVVAVFPGTLEELFGLEYDFTDEWGVSRGTFEILTLGTLAAVVLLALVGYALARDVRAQPADVALDAVS